MEGVKTISAPLYHVGDFWLGMRDSIPLMLGIAPFGIAYGVMAVTVGLTPVEAILMSLVVFAGASQFIAITMVGAGITSWSMIVFTTLLVNLRHLLMGASLAPHMLKLPVSWQLFLTFGMVDESYATTINKAQQEGYSPSYQLGANTGDYLTWIIFTVIGVGLGNYISDPLQWGLDFAMPATFLGMLIPRLIDRLNLLVFLIAGVAAILGAIYLPGKWYIIITCLAASLLGGIMEGRKENAH